MAALALSLLGMACTPVIEVRGNLPQPEQLAQIAAGKSTRDDVQALLGTPSNTSPFGDEAWYYISSVSERVSFWPPEETERKVITILFDKDGVVRGMTTKGLADSTDITPVGRETPTAGRDLGLIEQLFGNLGRFSNKDAKSQ